MKYEVFTNSIEKKLQMSKRYILLFVVVFAFTFSGKAQCIMNCSDFCVIDINNVDTTNNTLDVTIFSSDSACFVNYPVVIVTNSIGDTIANISGLFYFFGQLPGDTVTHTIPTTVDSIAAGFTGTVYFDDPTDSIPACSYSYPTTCTVGINELAYENSVLIYPNPASTIINISRTSSASSVISMYDVTGKMVRNFSTTESNVSLERGSLRSGIYFIQIVTDEKILTKKIILE